MDNKVLAPILAGMGLGWLAFSPEGREMAKGIGQTLMPALAPGKGKDEQKPDEAKKPEDEAKDKEDEA